jgi:hypothetical protein
MGDFSQFPRMELIRFKASPNILLPYQGLVGQNKYLVVGLDTIHE